MRNLFNYGPLRYAICMFAAIAAIAVVADRIASKEALSSKVNHAKVSEAIDKAANFLKKSQANDGSFSTASGPGITAIVGAALMRCGRTPLDPVVAKALKYLEGNVHEDGGIYQKGSNHKNYETCLAIVCFQEANKNHHYDKLLAKAEKFVEKEQWDEDEGKSSDDLTYGG